MTTRTRAPLSFSMRRVVRFLVWMFVFTQPWDTIVLGSVGALSRMVGIVTLGAALLTIAVEGRLRRPNAIFWLAAAYVADVALSQLWTISPGASGVVAWTYAQLLASVWIMQEFSRTREEHQSLLVAFCLGAFIPMASVVNNFRLGVQASATAERYSSSGALSLNADSVGLILVIGVPIALYLMRHNALTVRVMAYIYVVLGPVAVLLTATRTAFLAGIVALSIAPFTQLGRLLHASFTVKMLLRVTVLVIVVTTASVLVVPQSIWARLSTIQSEIMEGGRMSGRADIWKGGVQLFLERPLLGFGIAAFERALAGFQGRSGAPHNLLLGILVEQGIVGLCIFLALLGACVLIILRLPYPERKLWVGVMLAWLVGVMAINLGATKVTWLLFGLLAAQTAETSRRHISQAEQRRGYIATRPGFLQPVHSPHAARTSRG